MVVLGDYPEEFMGAEANDV